MGAFEKPKEPRPRRKMKSRLPLLLFVLVLLCAAIVVTVVLVRSHNNSTDNDLLTEPTETYSGVCIDTPAGALYYPEEWRDKVLVETESDPFSATLFADLEKMKVAIFTVYFGESGEGHLFGTAQCTNGERSKVWVEVHDDFILVSALTDEEIQTLYSMQERVNDIIEQIYLLPEFEAA